jgi:hypothetical protein
MWPAVGAVETRYCTVHTGTQVGWPPHPNAWQTSPRLQSRFVAQRREPVHWMLAMQNCSPPTAVSQKHVSDGSSVGSVACPHSVAGQTHSSLRQAWPRRQHSPPHRRRLRQRAATGPAPKPSAPPAAPPRSVVRNRRREPPAVAPLTSASNRCPSMTALLRRTTIRGSCRPSSVGRGHHSLFLSPWRPGSAPRS